MVVLVGAAIIPMLVLIRLGSMYNKIPEYVLFW